MIFIFFKVRYNSVGIVDLGIVESKGIGIRMMVVLSRRPDLKGFILEEEILKKGSDPAFLFLRLSCFGELGIFFTEKEILFFYVNIFIVVF